MGVKKENKTDMGYGAPSPINTPGNAQKYGAESWMNTTDVIQGEAEAYQSPYTFNNCRIREYEFDKSDYYAFFDGFGISGGFDVEGTSSISYDNILDISLSVKQYRPEFKISASISVIQDNMTISEKPITRRYNSYLYQKGGFTPLGEASIELPLSGSYKVKILVSALLENETGRGANNCTIYLPYSK